MKIRPPYVFFRTANTPHMYICELRGVNFVTWVSEKDVVCSCVFPEEKASEWKGILESLTGFKLEKVLADEIVV